MEINGWAVQVNIIRRVFSATESRPAETSTTISVRAENHLKEYPETAGHEREREMVCRCLDAVLRVRLSREVTKAAYSQHGSY